MTLSPGALGRLHNFSAGPACLPVPVLEKVRDQLLNYDQTGMSVLEMSHRSKAFDGILDNATAGIRSLLKLSSDYEVLFLQGGASLQFAMVPMNLALPGKSVDLIHTGNWTEMALKELKLSGTPHQIVASSEADRWTTIPSVSPDSWDPNASYAYLCSNNTIEGTQFKRLPSTGTVPLVVDMSSDFLSRPIEVGQTGLIFAGAQKNLGPSGVCVVIIRKDLVERGSSKLPTLLQYRTHAKAGSRYNTPPAFGIYVCGLVLDWIRETGGLEAMEKRNTEKASLLYATIDESGGFYCAPVRAQDRSPMNVVWRIQPKSSTSPSAPEQEALEERFLSEAKAEGLLELKGHRVMGGLRASLYNAQPLESVQALVSFMKAFQKKHG